MMGAITNPPPPVGHNSNRAPANVFCVSREIFKHPYVGAGNAGRDPWARMEAWLWLISKACFKPVTIDIRGDTVTLARGQYVTTMPRLADEWNWTLKQVRTFLDGLQARFMIGRETGTPKGSHQTVLTICNYDIYQFLEGYLGQPKGQPKGSPRAAQGQQKNTENTDNTENTKRESLRTHVPGLAGDPATTVSSGAKVNGHAGASGDLFGQVAPSKGGGGIAPPVKDTQAQVALELYNEVAARYGLPIARGLSPARAKSIAQRIREAGGIEGFKRALRNLEASAFLLGQNSRGWRADFDFLCQARTFHKVLDGSYGNGAHAQPKNPLLIRDPDMPDNVWHFKLRRLVEQGKITQEEAKGAGLKEYGRPGR